MTTALQCINSYKPFTLAGFELGIFCSVGGRDDHFATPYTRVHTYVHENQAECFVTKAFRTCMPPNTYVGREGRSGVNLMNHFGSKTSHNFFAKLFRIILQMNSGKCGFFPFHAEKR
jgi:hypothetical protein